MPKEQRNVCLVPCIVGKERLVFHHTNLIDIICYIKFKEQRYVRASCLATEMRLLI
jgi:hypothetical protein